jgi:thioesterase domain-containing protein
MRIEDMASHYVREVQAVQPMGPYYLGGYCMGGQIAYEMARIFRQQGHEVSLVALFDSYNSHAIWGEKTFLRRLSILQQKLAFHTSNVSRLKIKEVFKYILEKYRMAGELIRGKAVATLMVFQATLLGRKRDPAIEDYILDNNHKALRTYQPEAYIGRITLFKPERNYDTFSDPNMGWGDLAMGGIEHVELPVNPHAMLVEPYVKNLAAALVDRIVPERHSNPTQSK